MDDYRYSRAAARSLLFSFLDDPAMPYGPRRRFSRAWKMLTSDERAILRRHKTRSITGWAAETAAVDGLCAALRLADASWHANRKQAA